LFPERWDHETLTKRALAEILVNQHKILESQEDQMSALTNLQTAVTQLQTDVAAFIAANSGGATDAQLEALTTQIQAIDATVAPPATPKA
jgi:hypothetical protein